MTRNPAEPQLWWGTFPLPLGETWRWRIGALSVWLRREANEWRVTHRNSGDPFDATFEEGRPEAEPAPAEDVAVLRLAEEATRDPIRLTPVLPDRPVVSRPEQPFHVLGGKQVQIYVSSPLWLRVETGPPTCTLLELPLYRSSDTWVGPNTREGELCYASRTSCRHTLADLHPRAQRAVTPVQIHNRTERTLLIERLNLPVPYLPLVATPEGMLWTHGVTAEITREGETAEIEIARKPPREAARAKRLAPPRSDEGGSMITRALGALIG